MSQLSSQEIDKRDALLALQSDRNALMGLRHSPAFLYFMGIVREREERAVRLITSEKDASEMFRLQGQMLAFRAVGEIVESKIVELENKIVSMGGRV